jgi:hypothetical protein
MLTKSYKDYLQEQDLLHQIKEGDYLHIITEDGVETIRFDEDKLGSLFDLLKKIPSIGKKSKPDAKKPKVADKAKGGKRSSGLGRAAGAAGLGGLLGGLLDGGDIQSLFKQGYDIASNQFVGKNPITESLNKSVTEKFTDDVAHFVLDLR